MSEKNYLSFLKIGSLLSFVILFFVFRGMYFPFISSKQLSFNLLISILLVLGLVFLYQYPKYLPKKSLINWGIFLYFITLIMSLAVTVDFNLSFWGDIERMLGVFHLLHFLAFYLILITVFRTKKDYQLLLNTLIVSSVILSIYALITKNPQATIGNVAYTAGMSLMALFLEVIFLLKSKHWYQRLLYGLAFIFSFIHFVKSDISGSQAGLLAGVFVSILVLIFTSRHKKMKRLASGALIAFLILVSTLFYFRSHPAFDNTYMGKALRDFSTDNVTLNTRLISYNSALDYLIDHPVSLIFGVGHGNYALIFDQYFSARFYDYDRGATYFDRAHNTIIDIITTTGIIGLLAYLSIFIFVLEALIRAYRKNRGRDPKLFFSKIDLSLLLGLLTAYFVQNLAVFDSFGTYLYFFVLLSYFHFLSRENPQMEKEASLEKKPLVLKKIYANFLFPLIIILAIFSFSKNINFFRTIYQSVLTYAQANRVGILETKDQYREIFSVQAGLERDARKSFINLVIDNEKTLVKDLRQSEVEDLIFLTIEQAEKNESYNQYDNNNLLRLSRTYALASNFYLNSMKNQERASHYFNLALTTIDRAIESSPERVPVYLQKANYLLSVQKLDEALLEVEKARDLNLKMPDAPCQLINFYLQKDDTLKITEAVDTCLVNGGLQLLPWQSIFSSLEAVYYQQGRLEELIAIYQRVLEEESDNLELISKLALLYKESEQKDLAREMAERLVQIDEQYQEEAEAFIRLLEEESLE